MEKAQHLDRETVKKILIEKGKLEFEAEQKLANVRARSQEEAQRIVMIERTKVMDTLYMKHKVKMVDL